MAFPDPVPGLVIRYSYLWSGAFARGQEEGVKDRPCAVILVSERTADDRIVTVLPITHTPPQAPTLAVELPATVKRRIGLDEGRSWVVLTEANRFKWPGPDLRPVQPGSVGGIVYGQLPYTLFETIRTALIAAVRARRLRLIPRSE